MSIERDVIEIPAGYRSNEAGSFMAQFDELSGRLVRDCESLTPAELEWQPAPGMNTIGMLLAHNAIVEVFWTQVIEGKTEFDTRSILGIGMDDDGIPLAAEAPPPAALAGKTWDFYRDVLAKARVYAKRCAQGLTDQDLPGIRRRTRRNGKVEEFNVRWVLYHMLEHYAGHYGQVLVLRHQYRVMAAARA